MSVGLDFDADGEKLLLNAVRHSSPQADPQTVSVDLREGAEVVPEAIRILGHRRAPASQISEFFLFDAELLDRFYDRLTSDRERGLIQETVLNRF